MSVEVKNLAKFVQWANNRYRQTLRNIDFKKLKAKTPYGNLIGRIIHIIGAVDLWTKRLQGGNPRKMISEDDLDSWEKLDSFWQETDKRFLMLVEGMKEDDIQRVLTITSLEGETYQAMIGNILTHVAMHGVHHWAQIGALMRERKLPPLPETDYISFSMEKT